MLSHGNLIFELESWPNVCFVHTLLPQSNIPDCSTINNIMQSKICNLRQTSTSTKKLQRSSKWRSVGQHKHDYFKKRVRLADMKTSETRQSNVHIRIFSSVLELCRTERRPCNS